MRQVPLLVEYLDQALAAGKLCLQGLQRGLGQRAQELAAEAAVPDVGQGNVQPGPGLQLPGLGVDAHAPATQLAALALQLLQLLKRAFAKRALLLAGHQLLEAGGRLGGEHGGFLARKAPQPGDRAAQALQVLLCLGELLLRVPLLRLGGFLGGEVAQLDAAQPL